MRFRDKNGPLHHPILKPANLPDFLTVARMFLTKTAKGQFVLKPGSGSASKAKPKLILAEEDNIQHILASLALKVTRQSVIIAKLSSYPRKNRTKKALWELDNLRRSLHLLNYVDHPSSSATSSVRSTAASPITNWCGPSRMPTAANCESEPIRSNSSGANARGCWPTASSVLLKKAPKWFSAVARMKEGS